MPGSEFNPYQSPRLIAEGTTGDAADGRQLLVELQARIAALEAKLNANWFCGPLWKRVVAVIGHLILGYCAIVAVVLALTWTVRAIGRLLGWDF